MIVQRLRRVSASVTWSVPGSWGSLVPVSWATRHAERIASAQLTQRSEPIVEEAVRASQIEARRALTHRTVCSLRIGGRWRCRCRAGAGSTWATNFSANLARKNCIFSKC